MNNRLLLYVAFSLVLFMIWQQWKIEQNPIVNSTIVNTYFQTETGGIVCSPKYDQNTRQVPHGSVGQPFSKYIKINKLEKKNKKEIKILFPWPGMMKNVINGNVEWNKYWDKNGRFRLFDLATTKKNNVFMIYSFIILHTKTTMICLQSRYVCLNESSRNHFYLPSFFF